MTKTELISSVARDLGVSYNKATQYINCFFEHVGRSLRFGDGVCITGFGTFKSRVRKSCKVITPQGKKMRVPSVKTVSFRTGRTLKKVVRRKAKKIY